MHNITTAVAGKNNAAYLMGEGPYRSWDVEERSGIFPPSSGTQGDSKSDEVDFIEAYGSSTGGRATGNVFRKGYSPDHFDIPTTQPGE